MKNEKRYAPALFLGFFRCQTHLLMEKYLFVLLLLALFTCKTKKTLTISENEPVKVISDAMVYTNLEYSSQTIYQESFIYEILHYYARSNATLSLDERKRISRFLLNMILSYKESHVKVSTSNNLYIFSRHEDFDQENIHLLTKAMSQVNNAMKGELLLIGGKLKIKETKEIIDQKFRKGYGIDSIGNDFDTSNPAWASWHAAKALIMWEDNPQAVQYIIDNIRISLTYDRPNTFRILARDVFWLKNKQLTDFFIDEFVFSDREVSHSSFDVIGENEYHCIKELPIQELQALIKQKKDIQAIRAWLTQNRNNWHYTE
jgi:hypothetical protein